MGALETTMQAIVPQLAVAVAIAGLLVQDGGNSRSHLIGGYLVRMGEIDSRQLITA